MTSKIHPTAVIAPEAEIGPDNEIGPYVVIGPKVKLGARNKIGAHTVIDNWTTIGDDNVFSSSVCVGGLPQDLKYKGEDSRLIIGNGNSIREFATLHIGTATGRMETLLGDNNLMMANSHVAHDCILGNRNILANCASLAGHCRLGDGVILGGLVGVHQFCRIGSYAIMSAGSMVGSDVPPYAMGQGDRARLRGINIIGLRRAGMNHSEVSAIKRAYRHFFSSVGHYDDKIKTLPAELSEHPRIIPLVAFLSEPAKRGVLQPLRGEGLSDEPME